MKNKCILLLILFVNLSQAQMHVQLPFKTYTDFEVTRPITYTQIVTYDANDKGYDPVMVQVNSFNKEGKFIQEYTHILGKFESETAHNYVYNKGKLDSLNTLATAANFNVKTSFRHDKTGKISTEKATGVYANYERSYTYNKKGAVASVTTDYDNGGHNWTTFTYKNGALDLVTQIDGQVKEGSLTNYFAYYDGALFARWDNLDKDLYLFPSEFRHYRLTNHPDPAAAVKQLRALRASNKTAYNAQLNGIINEAEVTYEMGQSTPEGGDWTRRMTKDTSYGQTTKRFHFRKIVYADGTVMGSTDFDMQFFERMKNL